MICSGAVTSVERPDTLCDMERVEEVGMLLGSWYAQFGDKEAENALCPVENWCVLHLLQAALTNLKSSSQQLKCSHFETHSLSP